MKTFCCSIDLDYIVHRGGAAQMAGHVRLPGAETWATEAEIATHAVILKASGLEVMPTCRNYDAKGYCTGHDANPDR